MIARPDSWRSGAAPGKPEKFLRAVALLEARAPLRGDTLIDDAVREWLRGQPKTRRRVLEVGPDPLAGLLDRLSRPKWLVRLEADPRFARRAAIVTFALRDACRDHPWCEAVAGRVARRLVYLAAYGYSSKDLVAIASIVRSEDGQYRLWSVWGDPPDDPRPEAIPTRTASKDNVEQFLADIRHLLERSWPRPESAAVRRERMRRRRELPLVRKEVTRALRLEASDGVPVALPHGRAWQFRDVAIAQSALAPSPMARLVGRRVLRELDELVPEALTDDVLGCAVAAWVVAIFGWSSKAALDITPWDPSGPASFAPRTLRFLTAETALSSRVPEQVIELPLPDAACRCVDELVGRTGGTPASATLGSFIGARALELFWRFVDRLAGVPRAASHLEHHAPNECLRHDLLSPAEVSLVAGRLIGPWRSACSYHFGTAARFVARIWRGHCHMHRAAGIPEPAPYRADGDRFVGQIFEGQEDPLAPYRRTIREGTGPIGAEIDYSYQAMGRRPTAEIPEAGAVLIQTEWSDALIFADKADCGGRAPRILPCPPAAREVIEIARGQPGVGARTTGDARRRWPGPMRNVLRKVSYAATTEILGTSGRAMVYGHDCDEFSPFGALGPFPLSRLLGDTAQCIDPVLRESGVNDLMAELASAMRERGLDPGLGGSLSARQPPEPEMIGTRFRQSFRIPDPTHYLWLRGVIQEIRRRTLGEESQMPSRWLEMAIVALLAWRGVTPSNIHRYRAYYRPDSLIEGGTQGDAHFAALIPQADVGLGLIPIGLGDLSGACRRIALQLHRSRGGRCILSHCPGSLKWLRRRLGSFLIEMGAGPRPTGPRDPNVAWSALAAASEFNGAMLWSPAVAAMFSGSYLVPLNYVSVRDLLSPPGGARHPLLTAWGTPWRDPHLPSSRRIDRGAHMPDLPKGIFGWEVEDGACPPNDGPPDKSDRPCCTKKVAAGLADFFAAHMDTPSRSRMRGILEAAGCKEPPIVLAQVMRRLREMGALTSGVAIPFLPPDHQVDFLLGTWPHCEMIGGDGMVRSFRSFRTIASVLLLGTRPMEALRLRRDDWMRCAGEALLVQIRGTKNRRAWRQADLEIFATDPAGAEIAAILDASEATFREARRTARGRQGGEEFVCGNGREGRGRITGLCNRALASAWAKFRAIPAEEIANERDTKMELYDLRHAAAIRVLDHLLRTASPARLNGDVLVADAANQFGHHAAVFLASYIGTAILRINGAMP